VNRSEGNQPLAESAVESAVRAMRPGDIRYGYLHARDPYLSLLRASDRATIFIYRDPRDMLVSHVFYATNMYSEHGMHRYYTETMTSMEERLNAAIEGVVDPALSSVRQRYDNYLGWLVDYLAVRGFECTLSRSRAIQALKSGINSHKSGTFRKGQPGNWRDHFTDANKSSFNQVAGDLLIRLGYEQSNDW
jgi:hypothetical protein